MDSTNHIGSADSGVSVGERYIFEASDSNLNSEFIKSSEQLHSKANIGNQRSIPIQIECNYDGNGAKYSADLECNSTKPNQISHLERLIRTHSIWFIADLSREEAVRILHAKEEGVSKIFRYLEEFFSVNMIKLFAHIYIYLYIAGQTAGKIWLNFFEITLGSIGYKISKFFFKTLFFLFTTHIFVFQNFLIRQSSHANTLALSIKLGKEPM